MNQKNNVILVDKQDNEIGICEKIKAHKEGKLHRAFSIFIFNSKGELLLQQRAKKKYHSGGLWTNTVCSHPGPNLDIIKSAKNRLKEEMGFTTDVKELFSFVYKSDYKNGLTENEFDHVFIGYYDNSPKPNIDEVMDYNWMKLEDIKKDINKRPNNYTTWFKIILQNKDFIEKISKNKTSLKKKIINIIGQIRIYSLLDLVLFAYAIGSNNVQLFGIIFLHLSFLFYLKYTHKHSYRFLISKNIWIILGIIGIGLFFNIAVIGYLIASMFYVRKNQVNISPFAPFARGFQSYFLASGVLGFLHPLSFLAFIILAIRNFAGDLRDVIKDRKEKMNTLPIFLGFKKSYKYIHLVSLFLTSFIWWHISDLSIIWLVGIYIIQVFTYNITTR